MPPKLNLPAGIYSNGTEYSGAGRWTECNLIRWEGDVLKTIGGWQPRLLAGDSMSLIADPALEAVRTIECIVGNDAGVYTFAGSNLGVTMILPASVTDVTPAEFVAQDKDSVQIAGYGTYTYGTFFYGTPRPATDVTPVSVFSWGFAAWGDVLIACARGVSGQKLYKKETTDTLLLEIATSPEGVTDVIVTDERMVMTVGGDLDNRIVRWSDTEDYTDFSPTQTNTAGNYRLAGSGRLVAIKQMQGYNLIVGENDAFVGQFIGPPYVYGFVRIGTACGAVSGTAVAAMSDKAFWYGGRAFWRYDGSLTQVPCPVLDFFLADADPGQLSKVTAFANPKFNEVWWLYQSVNSSECDKYLAYNYVLGVWYVGEINRTAGIGAGALKYLTMIGADGIVYNHEIPTAGFAGSPVPFVQSGPLELENGNRLFGMAYVYPDDTYSGDLTMSVEVRNMPKENPLYVAVYELISPTSTHGMMGRDIRLRFASPTENAAWTLGSVRVDPVAGGTGKR